MQATPRRRWNDCIIIEDIGVVCRSELDGLRRCIVGRTEVRVDPPATETSVSPAVRAAVTVTSAVGAVAKHTENVACPPSVKSATRETLKAG
jgi:hypothetical protein